MNEEFDVDAIRAIRAKLLGYQAQCRQIMDGVVDRRSLSTEERAKLQDLYTNLKNSLKTEAAELWKSRDRLSRAKECFYEPAIRKAAVALRPPSNSNPISSRWFSALYDCEGEFSYVLHNMGKLGL